MCISIINYAYLNREFSVISQVVAMAVWCPHTFFCDRYRHIACIYYHNTTVKQLWQQKTPSADGGIIAVIVGIGPITIMDLKIIVSVSNSRHSCMTIHHYDLKQNGIRNIDISVVVTVVGMFKCSERRGVYFSVIPLFISY